MASMTEDDHLDAAFFALANPTRRAILARLVQGAATVNELAEPFEMSLPAISKHIGVLQKAGLISRGRNAQYRPCTLNAEALRSIAGWTDQYRHIWDMRFGKMNKVLQTLKETKGE